MRLTPPPSGGGAIPLRARRAENSGGERTRWGAREVAPKSCMSSASVADPVFRESPSPLLAVHSFRPAVRVMAFKRLSGMA